ncbi:hypothetical protein AUJ67_10460 [Candidatus Desantisbacteria bacterium CG1_02_49_89]|nr:MAG: hypothetical protein AUJ67_10460 [Candidatus Desantisbacteria bacterium CG1_02_49_89]
MKKILAGLFIAGILMLCAGAQAAVQNIAVGTFKNMAGTPFPETCSEQVTADIVGPQITVTKLQQNGRTGQSGSAILVASGDTIIYTIQLSNSGTDSATEVVITDTLAFETVAGQSVLYETSSATPDTGAVFAGGIVTALEYYNGSIWQGTTSGLIPTNAKGIRWIINLVTYGASLYNAGFTIKVTSP